MRSFRNSLLSGVIVLAVVCLVLVFINKRTASKPTAEPLILTPLVINQPLPPADLVDFSGARLGDDRLRGGKVVLIFTLTTCKPCDQENEFLKTVVNMRKDVSFFYVIPMGVRNEALKQAREKYCFDTFFDQRSMLARKLEVYQVPIKVFLEDGIIKRVWIEATVTDEGKSEFRNWLNAL